MIVLAAMAAACSPSPTNPPPIPSSSPGAAAVAPILVDAPCPPDIEVVALVEHTCGTLTVPEDRSKPLGRTIQLLMVRTPVPDGTPRAMIGTAFGGDLGYASAGVSAQGATRTRSVQVVLDPRGRRSEPSLTCPEVDALDVPMAEARSDDQGLRSQLVAAVSSCRERLAGGGIDVAMYDLANTAADLEDLRVAAGIDDWLIDTKGDTSLYTFEYLRHWSGHVGRVVLDSPRFPQNRGPRADLQAIEYAWTRFVDACAADVACAQLLPDPTASLRTAVARFSDAPVTVSITNDYLAVSAGRPVALLIDGQRLLRAVRFALGGDGPENARRLPVIIERAARGEVDRGLTAILGRNSPLCVGYRPECGRQDRFLYAQYLTVLCRDILPFDEAPTSADLAADSVGWASVLRDDPVRAACPAWDVPPADEAIGQPVTTSVPMLIYSGELDSWSARPLVEAAVWSLANARYYELAGQTHNVMGFTDCSIAMRNAWLDDPMRPPPDTRCLGDLHAGFSIEAPPG